VVNGLAPLLFLMCSLFSAC